MPKGMTGTSLGGSIEYRYQLKKTTKNCRNCKHYKKEKGRKYGWCKEFHIMITDCTNAKVCKGFASKHGPASKKKQNTKKNTKKKASPKKK